MSKKKKSKWFYKLCLFFCTGFISQLPAYGQNNTQHFESGGLSSWSHVDPEFQTCYRWVSRLELKQWLKGKPYFVRMANDERGHHLNRLGSEDKTIWCWLYPMGSIRGGPTEEYGEYLIQINLLPDRVLYDRNQKAYFSPNKTEDQISAEYRRGIDTEVSYSNYVNAFKSWMFQEIMIRSEKAIASWSFGNAAMKVLLEDELQEVESSLNLPLQMYHFYYNFCDVKTGPEYLGGRGFRRNPRLNACASYRQLARERYQDLLKFWTERPELFGKLIENPMRRPALF